MNSAIPIATGVARISAMRDDSRVPNASCKMPNFGTAASGLHACDVRKLALSAFRAGMALAMRNTAIAAMMRSSRMPEPRAEAPNRRSPRRPVLSLRPRPPRVRDEPCSRVSLVTRPPHWSRDELLAVICHRADAVDPRRLSVRLGQDRPLTAACTLVRMLAGSGAYPRPLRID